MKVYLIIERDYEWTQIIGVFKTRKLAQLYCRQNLKCQRLGDWYIEPFEVYENEKELKESEQ